MAVKLVAKQGFSAFGTDYAPGQPVDPAAASMWPDNAMATRLNNGYLEYRDVADDAPESGDLTNYEDIQRQSGLQRVEEGKDEEVAFGKMSVEDLKVFVEANDLAIDVDAAGPMPAKRKAVRDAYAAKLAAAPVGGVAGNVNPQSAAPRGDV